MDWAWAWAHGLPTETKEEAVEGVRPSSGGRGPMAEEAGGGAGPRLSKRFSDKVGGGAVGTGEVDYKSKSGTAWSHNFLNQKPWHPLSYPNQRRKWIAEQTHAQREKRKEEVAREFAQEQEFFRQTSLFSKKEKDKMETMKAVSFMYVRPPGYNAESAKAAEIADQKRISDQASSSGVAPDPIAAPLAVAETEGTTVEDKKKSRPKDVFGRALPTEEEFEVLKNAPRLETGAPARVKPFAVEIRNVRCVRCGTYGHQSGDRECPLRDAIMPNDESRLRRDDPLTTIKAQADSEEPVKWELKQRPGMSPPRGGFRPDDPNQQIVAEDIFDEYGGFLSGGDIPSLLANFKEKKTKKHSRKKSKHKKPSTSGGKYKVRDDLSESSDTDVEKKTRSKHRHKKQYNHDSDASESLDYDRYNDSTWSSNSSDSDYGKKTRASKGKQHKSKRLSPSLDFDDRNSRKRATRKHNQRDIERLRITSSDFAGNYKSTTSKRNESAGHHHHHHLHEWSQSSSDSDTVGRRISQRKHDLQKKERYDASRRTSSRKEICHESDPDRHKKRRKHHRY